MTANDAEARNTNRASDELLDVVMVGGGQAGLAMAWHLTQQHLRFVVLDAAPEIGHTWSSRWDSLKLFTPTQHDALPGMAFPGPPDTYPGKDAVAGYLRAYAAAFNLPIRLNAGSPASPRRLRASRSAPRTRSSAPARWWWQPGHSRCPSCRRPPSGWTAR
jgi:cation diffusion facilitator CzcD-associated flavoprotein CzcO